MVNMANPISPARLCESNRFINNATFPDVSDVIASVSYQFHSETTNDNIHSLLTLDLTLDSIQ